MINKSDLFLENISSGLSAGSFTVGRRPAVQAECVRRSVVRTAISLGVSRLALQECRLTPPVFESIKKYTKGFAHGEYFFIA